MTECDIPFQNRMVYPLSGTECGTPTQNRMRYPLYHQGQDGVLSSPCQGQVTAQAVHFLWFPAGGLSSGVGNWGEHQEWWVIT